MTNRTLVYIVLTSALFVCACSSQEVPKPTSADRALLVRAVGRAAQDSTGFISRSFTAPATLVFQFRQGDTSVSVEDKFDLVKVKDSTTIQTAPKTHTVTGDTSLLKDMYTFRTSQGVARGSTQGQLVGLHFGADFLRILRVLQSDTTTSGYTFRDTVISDSVDVGDGVSHLMPIQRNAVKLMFVLPDRSGTFILDRDSLALLRTMMRLESSYVVGSYEYALTTMYEGDLPVFTESIFNYRRLFTRGNGSMKVTLNRP